MNLVFPGTFNPFHKGHLDVVKRASEILTKINSEAKVIIGIAHNPDKKDTFLTIGQRLGAIIDTIDDNNLTMNVFVELYSDATVEFCKRKDALLVRGLRNSADFEYERPMAEVNRSIGVETFFIITSNEFSHVSSSLVRNMRSAGLPIHPYVPSPVVEAILRIKD